MEVELPKAPLEGKELIQRVKELKGLNVKEKAKLCGYYSAKNGHVRANTQRFFAALLEAKGLDLDRVSEGEEHYGRYPQYELVIQSTGHIVVGRSYTRAMGWQPGHKVSVELKKGYKDQAIILRLKQG